MNVTKATFGVIVDDILPLIESCDFYAVDQEMTGIEVPKTPTDLTYTMPESYPYKRAAACRYTAFQFGLCLFHKKVNAETNEEYYEARPFNFQLRNGGHGEDVVLSMSAIEFLAKNSMDFQMWLANGLPFATAKQEAEHRERLFPTAKPKEELTSDEKAWVEKTLGSVKAWLAKEEEKKAALAKEEDDEKKKALAPTEKLVLNMSHCSIEADICLHQELINELGKKVTVDPPLDGRFPRNRRDTAYTLAADEAAWDTHRDVTLKKRERLFRESIGFRRIWKALMESGKPHLGHNYSSDLMFMMHQHEDTLANNYDQFKKDVFSAFPHLYDTKVVAQHIPHTAKQPASTSLEPLYKEIKKRATAEGKLVKIKLPMGFEAYHEDVARVQGAASAVAHQGAFDAYMTGHVFLQMQALFGEEIVTKSKNLIGIFGCLYFMNTAPDTADPLAACYPVMVSHPYSVESDQVEDLFATDVQREALTKAREARKKGDRQAFSKVAKDFWVRRVDSTHHIVLFLPETTMEVVEGRVNDALLAQGKAAAKKMEGSDDMQETAEERPAIVPASLPEGCTFVPFEAWKAKQKTDVGSDALPAKVAKK